MTLPRRDLRPPIHQATLVRSDVEHTFATFVRTIGEWWPVDPFSLGRERVRRVTFEQRLGGRVYETWDSGETREWGDVLAWSPPSGFTMTWLVTGVPTEVELGFTRLGPALTRVTVEHRGWDALTEEQLTRDCALPGGYANGSFAKGWELIFAAFAASFDEQRETGK
jgi:hypothetical protein